MAVGMFFIAPMKVQLFGVTIIQSGNGIVTVAIVLVASSKLI